MHKQSQRSTIRRSVGIALPLLAACAGGEWLEGEGEVELGQVSQHFEVSKAAEHYLITRVRAGSMVQVCLTGTGVTAATRPGYEADIRRAILAWVDGARAAATLPLITAADVSFSCSSPQVSVDWSSTTGRAFSNPLRAKVNLYSGDTFPVVLHELGHLFGLNDTYVEGVWTCKPGQPKSVMCENGNVYAALQPDDLNGIREVYCLAYPSAADCTRRAELDMGWCYHPDAQLLVGDFNGDRRADLLCHDTATGHKWIARANASGRLTGEAWDAPLGWCHHDGAQLFVGDFNADGRSDLLCHDSVTGHKWIAQADPAGHFTGTTWDAPLGWCYHDGAQLFVGDFNADGRSDLLCHDSVTGHKWIAQADPAGHFTGTTWDAPLGWCYHDGAQLFVGDFNGDRRSDLLCADKAGQRWTALADPAGHFTGTTWEGAAGWCSHAGARLVVADFNADGRSDLGCHDELNGDKWIAFADASGQFAGTSRGWRMNWCHHASAELFVGDFDGNGASDFLCHDWSNGEKWQAFQFP